MSRFSRCRRISFAAVLFCMMLVAEPRPAEAGPGADPVERVDAFLTRLVPFGYSGAVIVERDGKVVLRKAYGMADREAGVAMTPDHVFTIGSITKQFTGAAILKLEMQGKLSTDDLLSKYIDGVPADKKSITLHQLLTHTAGFGGASGDDFAPDGTRDRVVRQVLAEPLLSAPGETYRYSNIGYSLLGAVVEIVSGQSYEAYLAEHLFAPAGMKRTGYLLPGYEPSELAVGYREGRRWGTVLERPMLEDGPSWHLRANGGIHSTVDDMRLWHRALLDDTVLSAAAREKYFHPFAAEGPDGESHYGYGWSISESPTGGTRIAHNGGNMVFGADCHRYVEDGLMMFVTKTSSESEVDALGFGVADTLFGEGPDLPPAVVELDDEALERLAGTYSVGGADAGAASTFTVTFGGGKIELRGGGRSSRLAKKHGQTAMAAFRSWIVEDDPKPLHAAMAGAVPLERLQAGVDDMLGMREEMYGSFREVSVAVAREEAMQCRVVLRMTHERGAGLVQCLFAGDDLVEIRPLQDLPKQSRTLHPVSPTRFESFSLVQGGRVRADFAATEDGGPVDRLVVSGLGSRKIRAMRVD